MLNNKAFSSYSVDDLEKAKKFYSEILEFSVKQTDQGLEFDAGGGQQVFLYPKRNHVPATFTVLNLLVTDIEQAVDTLTARGVVFEKYNDEHMKTDEKGISQISETSGPAIAWFKDPAGNFLSLIKE